MEPVGPPDSGFAVERAVGPARPKRRSIGQRTLPPARRSRAHRRLAGALEPPGVGSRRTVLARTLGGHARGRTLSKKTARFPETPGPDGSLWRGRPAPVAPWRHRRHRLAQ